MLRDFQMPIGYMLGATYDLRATSRSSKRERNAAAMTGSAAWRAFQHLKADRRVDLIEARSRTLAGPTGGQWSAWVVLFDRSKQAA